MYEIYKVGEDLYQLHSDICGFQAMEGTALAIQVYAATIGINPDEIEFGFFEMMSKGHDAANYGINRMFIYSFNRQEKYGKKVS